MPLAPHIERHFTASDSVRDIVIGMSDGLTVPFALAAGLAGAVPESATGLVLTAGTAVFEPALGVAKRRIGARLGEMSRSMHGRTAGWRRQLVSAAGVGTANGIVLAGPPVHIVGTDRP